MRYLLFKKAEETEDKSYSLVIEMEGAIKG